MVQPRRVIIDIERVGIEVVIHKLELEVALEVI